MSAAEAMAMEALAFIAEDDFALERLLNESGLDLETLRLRAADPVFLGFVLDFLFNDEVMASAFANRNGYRPEDLRRARAALPGDAPHWT